MPRIIMSLLSLLGVEREQICEPNTNNLFWKKAKNMVCSELPERMESYSAQGAKPGQFK